MNWGTYIADVNGVPTAFPQPDNDGNCVMMKFNVLSDNFDWKGTFDNVDCNKTSYFICEKRTIQNCTGFITGQNDNCYKLFTTSRTYNDAEAYCESIDSHLLVIDDEKEFRFIKNNSKDSAKLKFDQLFQDELVGVLDNHLNLYQKLDQSPELKKFVQDKVFEYVIRKIKK